MLEQNGQKIQLYPHFFGYRLKILYYILLLFYLQLETFKTALENDIKENSVPYEKTIVEYEDKIMPEVISTMEELQPFGTDFKKLVFTFRGIFESYDKITKIAIISGKEFRMFISEANANLLLNTEIKINFVISFSSVINYLMW